MVQDAQLGMGHAVHLCEQHVKGEPFMLVLGDHLYATTDSGKGGCMQQLIDYYGHHQRPCVAVQDTAEEQALRRTLQTALLSMTSRCTFMVVSLGCGMSRRWT